MSVSLAVWLTSSKAASDNKNGNGLDFTEERRKRAQARKKAAALSEKVWNDKHDNRLYLRYRHLKAKLSAAGDNKLNSTKTSVTSNSTCQLLQLSSGQPLPSLLDELSSEFSVAHLSLNILAHERLQQSLEDRLAPRPGSEFCPSTNVVYMVHPNMAVTRETRINGRAIEVRYAGEYVFVDSESTYLFVNYVPCAHHNILCCSLEQAPSPDLITIYDSTTSDADFLAMIGYKENDDDTHRPRLTRNSLEPNYCAHRAHTPVESEMPERCSPSYLSNRWTVLVHKLLALTPTESNIFFQPC